MSEERLSYVIVTPARNEGKNIRRTIESMIAQTAPPLRWIIVSDGSTDNTDEIVGEYMDKVDWLELVRRPPGESRDFGAKARAFAAGVEHVADLDYDLIGNLDADLAFRPEYFAFLLDRYSEMPKHGLLGTVYADVGTEYLESRTRDVSHVPGACQLFRRKCFEEIGGYTPLPTGGMDLLAELRCRHAGWKTHAFDEHVLVHLRPVGTATRTVLGARFNYGYRDYYFGAHPLWQLLRFLNQLRMRPIIIGGICIAAGYLRGHIMRHPSPVPPEIRAFRRQEQRDRIRRLFSRSRD